MLPKLVMGWKDDVHDFLHSYGLSSGKVLLFNSEESSASDFRAWIDFVSSFDGLGNTYDIVVWGVNNLSVESQNVLLKPLEEKHEKFRFFLVSNGSSEVIPTIMSRSDVVKVSFVKKETGHWLKLLKMWRSSPSDIILFCEQVPQDDVKSFLHEVIINLKIDLKKNINKKRLKILNMFLISVIYVDTNVNKRLLLENLLLETWRVIKT